MLCNRRTAVWNIQEEKPHTNTSTLFLNPSVSGYAVRNLLSWNISPQDSQRFNQLNSAAGVFCTFRDAVTCSSRNQISLLNRHVQMLTRGMWTHSAAGGGWHLWLNLLENLMTCMLEWMCKSRLRDVALWLLLEKSCCNKLHAGPAANFLSRVDRSVYFLQDVQIIPNDTVFCGYEEDHTEPDEHEEKLDIFQMQLIFPCKNIISSQSWRSQWLHSVL